MGSKLWLFWAVAVLAAVSTTFARVDYGIGMKPLEDGNHTIAVNMLDTARSATSNRR